MEEAAAAASAAAGGGGGGGGVRGLLEKARVYATIAFPHGKVGEASYRPIVQEGEGRRAGELRAWWLTHRLPHPHAMPSRQLQPLAQVCDTGGSGAKEKYPDLVACVVWVSPLLTEVSAYEQLFSKYLEDEGGPNSVLSKVGKEKALAKQRELAAARRQGGGVPRGSPPLCC